MKLTSLSEKEIQNSVLSWLSAIGLFAFHIPNHGKWDPKTRRYNRTDKHHVPGIPDICIFLSGGKTVWIELKSAKGRMSTDQIAVGSTLRNMGHSVAVCHSVEEVETFLRGIGALS